MEQEFIPYEQALTLKELGFDGGCFSLYFNNGEFSNFIHAYKVNDEVVEKTNSVLAPTFSQAFRWFREKYNMLANVYSNASGFLFEYHDTIGGTHRYDSDTTGPNDSGCWDTYEEAELEWLENKFYRVALSEVPALFEEAKELEKQQIVDCGNSCAFKQHLHSDRINKMSMEELEQYNLEPSYTFGEEYYNETFNK
jgi:hypothetical protein